MDVVAQCLHGRGCLAAPVRAKVAKDIMSVPVVTAVEETPVMEVADLFTRHGINRVPRVESRWPTYRDRIES